MHYVWGGTGAVGQGLVDLIEGQGGAIRTHAPVDKLILEGDRAAGVVLDSGEEIPADVVVSNADSAWMYDHLLKGRKPKRWTRKKLKKLNYSMSLFVWYFGTDKKFEDVEHHTILMGPRYHDLLTDIFDRKIQADDFSLYLHRPTATDPSLAPDGCDAFYVLSPVPHLESHVDWTTMCETYRKRIEKRLEETIMPGLGDHIASSKIMTPLDFRDRLNAPLGAAFGPEPTFTQSGWFRPHNVSEEIENLFLVGATTHPGAGLPGVVTSAKVLDRVIPHADDVVRAREGFSTGG